MLIKSEFEGYSKDGIRLYFCDGSGGGSGSADQTVTQKLAPYAEPYAKEVLGKGQALSNVNYQTYGGERQAQFTPLMQKAYEDAGKLGPSLAGFQGIDMARTTGERALNAPQFDPYATGQFGAQASQYMDPYMQNVVGIQQREAQRMADIQGTQRGAEAVKSGAFGGSRQAIMDAEAARNLAIQQGDIQARGLQDAFGRGQNQFNTEQQQREQSRQFAEGQRQQGLQTALQSAGQLGALGSQQFAQGFDANLRQQQFGTQQQQQVQNILDGELQDFRDQQRAPYQQVEFLSNLLRGTPTGSVQELYRAPPTLGSQLLGAGTALGGAYLTGAKRAKGGTVTSGNSRKAGLNELALTKMRG